MKALIHQNCPLCENNSNLLYKDKQRLYYKCFNCMSVFLDRNHLPGRDSEKKRYLEHNNDVNDPRYRRFVKPIIDAVLRDFAIDDTGMDYGAGTGPVISKILKENDYMINQYDPFFHYSPELLKNKYNYIVCCEVIEHFHNPVKDFKLLREMLWPGGKLYCMTELYDDSISFHNWYYKNDPTHVFFYNREAFEWIVDKYGFSKLEIDGRLVTFVA